LEKEGIIKEYTMIPDFAELGYQIMGVTLAKSTNPERNGTYGESRKAVVETEQKKTFANVIGVKGLGLGRNRIVLSFYKSYSDYIEPCRSQNKSHKLILIASIPSWWTSTTKTTIGF
jgi:DNA-binding Lrp family transcriptional regulator